MSSTKIAELLGAGAESLLNHQSKTISKEHLHLPGPDFPGSHLRPYQP
ncbi:hypothetical protein [Candidatus Pollutiaquabacter sp.]